MDRGMFSSSSTVYLIESGMDFILPTSYAMKEIRGLALSSRKTVEKAGNIISISGEIMFTLFLEIPNSLAFSLLLIPISLRFPIILHTYSPYNPDPLPHEEMDQN
ncbi:MAG: hypothetical protein M1454_05245 [Candidatus Thermoplasmatota archaeon]|nr:hypothetical protein [Candidatus Thermoplasmatota archaeon]MCL5731251.1 hypothetical protein [Candidatus Thermoplasmatota archaeon]